MSHATTPRSAIAGLVLVGASYRTAPAEIRDRLASAAAPGSPLGAALARTVGTGVILATCNRTEVYAYTDPGGDPSTSRGARAAAGRIIRLLSDHTGLPVRRLRPHLYTLGGIEASRHLIRVAAGLDSLVLGEPQIQGQVRAAWLRARDGAALGAVLDELFRRAVTAGRTIRAATGLTNHPSVASVAATLIGEELGGLHGKSVAVVGAGSTGKAAAWSLLQAGARVTLVNRSPERAAATAHALRAAYPAADVQVAPLDDLPAVLERVDAALTATAAPEPLVDASTVEQALSGREGLLLVDIAIPRNVAPAVREVAGARVVDIDDLAQRCPVGLRRQRQTLAHAESCAQAEAERFGDWCAERAAVPAIAALRSYAVAIRAAELRRLSRRLSGLSPRDRQVVETLTAGIVNKLLHAPTLALREASLRGRAPAYGRAVAELFSLGPHAC